MATLVSPAVRSERGGCFPRLGGASGGAGLGLIWTEGVDERGPLPVLPPRNFHFPPGCPPPPASSRAAFVPTAGACPGLRFRLIRGWRRLMNLTIKIRFHRRLVHSLMDLKSV